jgi:hypothetical protein
MRDCVEDFVWFQRFGAGLDDNRGEDRAYGFPGVCLHVVDSMLDVGVDGFLESIYPGLAVFASAGNRE